MPGPARRSALPWSSATWRHATRLPTDRSIAVTHTDKTYDVIVVGTGAAGSTAAIAAHDAGASVLMLDTAYDSEAGGNRRVSGGGWGDSRLFLVGRLVGGTPRVCQRCGAFQCPDPTGVRPSCVSAPARAAPPLTSPPTAPGSRS